MGIFRKTKIATEAIQAAGNIVDNVVTNQQERGVLKNQFTSIITQLSNTMQQQVTARHRTDMQSKSWLSRHIRPISLLLVVFGYMFSKHIGLTPDQASKLWDWGDLMVKFYFGSKIMEHGLPLVQNFTKSLRRKG